MPGKRLIPVVVVMLVERVPAAHPDAGSVRVTVNPGLSPASTLPKVCFPRS